MQHEKEDYIFGIHPVVEALKEGKDISRIFMQMGLKGESSTTLFKLAKEGGIEVSVVPMQKLQRITRKNHQGVIAIMSPIGYERIENIIPVLFEQGKTPLLLLLDRVTDVRNFGAICRSAECLGVQAVIVPSRGSALVTPDAVKTSAGALLKIPVCKEPNLKETIDYLKQSGIQMIGCSEKGEKNLSEVSFTEPCCILMGSEEDGISPEYLKKCDELVKIPMSGTTESLNVSVSAGIILYEATRQRNG
ncbi:MAG: 23S rRNA (guanosine(2251)-2'-O)-methyltransferase RlmB [Flavobacteriales bacterium]